MKSALVPLFRLLTVLLVLSSTTAMAQRGGPGGGRGPGGFGGGFGGFGGGGSTLGLLQRESVAEELKLTDEQKTKIRELSDKMREDTRIRDLFGKMGTASEEERAVVQAEIAKVMESMRQQADVDLKKVLDSEQFTRYRQMALQTRGVSALGDTDVAGELKLSEDQIAKLKAISEESDKKRREMFESMRQSGFRGGDEMRTKFEELRKESEDKRMAVLTPDQRKSYETMRGPEMAADPNAPGGRGASGGSSGAGDASSRFTRRTAVGDVAAATSQTDEDKRPPVASFGKAADELASAKAATKTEAPAEGESPKPAVPNSVEKMTFNFRHAAWADVLKAFAELAGLTLDLNVVPPGTFNYFDEKQYTPVEALDVINGYLLQKGFVLVRRDQFLVVLNIDDGIPPNLIPHVTVEELPKRGRNELMNLILRVENITADEAAEEAKELIGPQGTVSALKRANAISITDIGSNLRRIHELLVGLNAAPTDVGFRSFDLKHIDALDAEDKVRALFGLQRGIESVSDGASSRYRSESRDPRDPNYRPPTTPTTAKPKVQVAVDERTNRLLVTASGAEMKIIEETLKAIDVEEQVGVGRKPRSREPYLHVYQVKTADPMEVAKTLNVLYPGCVVNEDGRARRLHIHATPSQHELIERTIKQLDGEGGGNVNVAVVPTGRIDSLTAVATLQQLYAAEREAAPSITPHPTGYGLIVRGTLDQVNQIKMLVTQLDPNAMKGEPQKGTLRTVPLGGRDPEEFTRMLQQLWSTRSNNPIIVIPSQTKPIQDRRVPSAINEAGESDQPSAARPMAKPISRDEASSREPRTSEPERPRRKSVKPNATQPASTQPEPRAQGNRLSVQTVSLIDTKEAASQETLTPAKKKKKAGNKTKSKKPQAVQKDTKPSAEPPASDSSAASDAAVANGTPIMVLPSGSNLILKSNDEGALDELEKLIELMQESTPSKPRWTIFYLRSADASEAATMLERLFPTSSVSSGSSSSGGMLGELTSGMSSMGRSLMNATGLSNIGASALALRIIPDVRSNALYVSGPAEQVREVDMMLRVLDASELPDQLRERTPRRIEMQHAEAEEVATMIRELYKDDMTPEGQQPGQQPNPFQMFMGGSSSRGGSSGRSGGQQGRSIKLTLSVDARTNALLVSASDSLFRQIEGVVESLDDAARAANRTVRVVDIKGANSVAVQSALGAMYSKIKVTSGGRTRSGSSSSSSGSSGSSSSSSAPPSMSFPPPFMPFGGFPGSSGSSGGSSDMRSFFEQRMRERGSDSSRSPFGR